MPEPDVVAVLEAQLEGVQSLASRVTADQETFAYAPGKWTVREVVGHVGDCERVFGFRALAFSRLDETPLPGFDENSYVANAPFRTVPLVALAAELALMRQANLHMLRGLGGEQWARAGTANNHPITVRALAFMMAGHMRHHLAILKDRYRIDA